jgi:hypothetical protein
VFIAGINDTGDELFTGVNDTGDYALTQVVIDSMTPAINISPVSTTLLMVNRWL